MNGTRARCQACDAVRERRCDTGTRACRFVNAAGDFAPGNDERVAFAQAHTGRVNALLAAMFVRLGCRRAQVAQQ